MVNIASSRYIKVALIGLVSGIACAIILSQKDEKSSDSSDNLTNQHRYAKTREPSIEASAAVLTSKPNQSRQYVELPADGMARFIQNNVQRHMSRQYIDQGSLDETLILLGATKEQCSQIKEIFNAAEPKVSELEKSHTKLGEITADHISFDRRGMIEPINQLIEGIQDEIRGVLPGQASETLISALDLENKYYPMSVLTSPGHFEIVRGNNALIAHMISKSHGSGWGIDLNQYRDDGTPIPADKVFGEQWALLLKGKNLLPKDAPEEGVF